MPTSRLGFIARKNKCLTRIHQGIAYFIPMYLVKVVWLQDISKTRVKSKHFTHQNKSKAFFEASLESS